MPKEILDNEISYIEELGVEIKTNSPIKDLESIFDQGYKAIFLGIGCPVSMKLGIPNEDAKGVIYALDFLKQVNSGTKIDLGNQVAVIGGGSGAIDAARTSSRLGASEVHLVCLESRDLTSKDRMLAQDWEIEEAENEGLIIHPYLGPKEILTNEGKVVGLETIVCTSVRDEDGRFAPKFAEGPAPSVKADTVIIAIGQRPRATDFEEVEKEPSGTIKVDGITLETNIKGVFAGGDAVLGPADVISAIARGQEAATSIELYLEGVDLKEARPTPPKRVEDIPKEGVAKEVRNVAPVLEGEKRESFAEVELGFSDEIATRESKRCLNCSIFAEKDVSETTEMRGIGIKIAPGAYIHVLPIEAGFVGADNVGVLIAEAPYNQDSMELIIDIGTNGELILGNRKKLVSCSCATGPAFEGAEIKYGMRAAPGAIEKIEIGRDTKEVRFKIIDKEGWNTDLADVRAKGICGSGIIDAVPQLFMAGIIDYTGRFNKDLKTPRLRITDNHPEFVIAWADETSIGQDIVICQEDIRNIQLAKAALYAGAKIMMRRLGVDKLDKVILAGAFGSYIDKESAACLGLFPDCCLRNIYAVGNAAGDGARIALLNVDKRKEADKIARQVEYVELTVEPDFEKVLARSMWIPHMKDSFPHLEHLLPAKATDRA